MKLNEAKVNTLYRVDAIYSSGVEKQDPVSLGIELETYLKVLAISGKSVTVLANDQQLLLGEQLVASLEVSEVVGKTDIVDTKEHDKVDPSQNLQVEKDSLPNEEPAPVSTGLKVMSILTCLTGFILTLLGLISGWFGPDFTLIVWALLFMDILGLIVWYFVFGMHKPELRKKNAKAYYFGLFTSPFPIIMILIMKLL